MAEQKFIKQIKLAENQVYDIATAHSITFTGVGDENVVWNGLSDVTVSIPTIADLIDTPVRFAGVVKKDGEEYYVEYNNERVDTFSAGDLVFFSENISNFVTETGTTIACESGDMAVHDGSKWNVVTGEHQVSINEDLPGSNGVKTASIGDDSATEVLDIEGKKLALKVNLNAGGNESVGLTGTATSKVGNKYIKIVEDSTTTANGTCTVGLNDKNVTLAEGLSLVKSVTLPTLSGGTLASCTKNSTAINCPVTGGKLTKTGTAAESGEFVDGVDVSLSLSDNNNTEGTLTKIVYDSSLNTGTETGNTFVTGIKLKENGETANFNTAEFSHASYISSIGNYISAVTGGSFKDGDAVVTNLVYGLGDELSDNSNGNGVVYDVDVSAPTDVLKSASVENGVLSFAADTLSITPKYKSFKQATYTPVSSTPGNPTTGTLTKKEYVFKTGHDTMKTYTISNSYKYLDVVEDITYGTYNVSNISVSIPSEAVVIDVDGGAFPTFTSGSVTPLGVDETTIGTVSDSLIGQSTASVNVNTYKLSTADSTGDGIITVGAEGDITTNVIVNGNIDLSSYYKKTSGSEN